MDIAHLYPPTPRNVPPDITRLDSAYRWRVVAMIGGLFAFLFVYLLVIALTGAVAFVLFTLPLPDVGGQGVFILLVLKVGGALAVGLLALFLLKGLFKNRRVERFKHISLKSDDYPELFAFIKRVHEDTRSRPPRHVYVSPEINAALVYDTSLINLIVPPRKDLLIGLGLVNVVNLSEFKAILAHEFGHFAQRSIGFGSYLYVANQVMQDVIYGRDALDRFVDYWCRIDARISFPAWGLKGILWLVRKGLAGIYKSLNLLHLSLSRQMEFNADNVAVSVAGSDAAIHGLARTEFANECMADAAASLGTAADNGLFTDDLFYHQTKAAERLRRLRDNPRLGLPPDPSDAPVAIFTPPTDGIPDKYRSHPTDFMREQNAKRVYVPGPRDDRTPWLLFGNPARLKRDLSESFYRHVLHWRETPDLRPAPVVQGFVDAEHAETTYDRRYQGWYDDRLINPGDLEPLPTEPWPTEEIFAWLVAWPPADLEQRSQAFRERQNEFSLLSGLKSGQLTLASRTFTFRNAQCTAKDVERLYDAIDKELIAASEEFHSLDRQVFHAHWSLAKLLDNVPGENNRESELLARYRFHMVLQGLLKGMLNESHRLQAILRYLTNNNQLSESEFVYVRDDLRGIHQTLKDNLEDSRRFTPPVFTNVRAGATLFELIVDHGDTSLEQLSDYTISADWLSRLMTRVNSMIGRTNRLHFKSLGAILAIQERYATEWKASADRLTTI